MCHDLLPKLNHPQNTSSPLPIHHCQFQDSVSCVPSPPIVNPTQFPPSAPPRRPVSAQAIDENDDDTTTTKTIQYPLPAFSQQRPSPHHETII